MIGYTIDGVQVHIFKKGDRYMVINGIDIYYTTEKPITDQDILSKKRRELYRNL